MKVITIVLISLFALQQVVALPEENYAVKNSRSVVSEIVETLKNLIKSTMNNILEEIDKAIGKIGHIMYDGIELVNDGIHAMLDAINEFEKKALDLGFDIAVCIGDQKQLIVDMKDSTIKNLKDTANSIIDGINGIENEFIDTIYGYLNVVQKLLDDFQDCGINPICITRVIAKATATSIELTAELPLLAARIIRIVGQTVVGGTADLAKIITEFTLWSVRIMTEITSCIAEIMPLY